MTGAPLPVVLDVDTGVDDALALLYAVASPHLDLRAVTCVGGNTDLAAVLANTLAVLSVAGAHDVPVHVGHAWPASGPTDAAEQWHGADGLMGLRPGPDAAPVAEPHPEHAVTALARLAVEAADAGSRLTLVPLGPQTNVADALRRHHDDLARLAAVHFMGGSGVGGNVTAAAEFNVHHDPEAAAEVLGAPVPVRMYGLEVFEHVRLPRADVERLEASAHPALHLAGRLCAASAARSGTPDTCLGDAGAVAALVRPDLVHAERRQVAVQLGDGPARGATVVDRRHGDGRAVMPDGHPVDVHERVDGPALAEHWLRTLTSAFR